VRYRAALFRGLQKDIHAIQLFIIIMQLILFITDMSNCNRSYCHANSGCVIAYRELKVPET